MSFKTFSLYHGRNKTFTNTHRGSHLRNISVTHDQFDCRKSHSKQSRNGQTDLLNVIWAHLGWALCIRPLPPLKAFRLVKGESLDSIRQTLIAFATVYVSETFMLLRIICFVCPEESFFSLILLKSGKFFLQENFPSFVSQDHQTFRDKTILEETDIHSLLTATEKR